MLVIFLGFGLLVFTWVDYTREETDIYLYGVRLGIPRDDYPLVFWGIILGQCAAGAGAIIYGLLHLRA